MQTLVLTDNPHALAVAQELDALHGGITIRQSPRGALGIPAFNVKTDAIPFDLVLSIHCKQIFPPAMVDSVRCVNVHPGLNPHNRGWFPQVFSIINGLPFGVTIHEIDRELDHGPIIVQRECAIEPWDTSGSVYARVMELERELVLEHFVAIRDGTYQTTVPSEGNVNLKRDFDALCELDMSQAATYGEVIDRLRALTHGEHRNAYFIDNGRKVFVRVELSHDGFDGSSD